MGTIIKATLDGVEREFEALSSTQVSKRTHHFIDGEIMICHERHNNSACPQPLCLIHPQHTFGSIVFEETGEDRIVQVGEWSMPSNYPVYQPCQPSLIPHPILRPMALV